MKKVFAAIIVILVLIGIVISLEKKSSGPSSESIDPFQGMQCYQRIVIATPEAPYMVEEYIALSIANGTVVGQKFGTQIGPDMSNGYQGKLTGSNQGGVISVLFNYTVEGASQSEQEEYIVRNNDLFKERYPLIEANGVLVPDKTQSFVEQQYKKINCDEVPEHEAELN